MNDTIPASLVRYQQELEEAIRRDLAGTAARRRRRRIGTRLLLAAGATGAVALGSLSVIVTHAPSTVAPAAAAIIRHATVALTHAPGSILHVSFTETQDNGNGTTVSWSQESFSQQRPPYNSRLINRELPGTPPGVEQATVSGVSEVYDPTHNTIYVGPRPSRANAQMSHENAQYRFSPGPTHGTYRVRAPIAFARVKHGSVMHVRTIWHTVVVTNAQAKALRDGRDLIRWTFHDKGKAVQATNPRVVRAPRPSSSEDASAVDPFSAAFRGQILALLHSGHARVLGHTTVAGRDTIEIRSSDGHTTFYVAAHSYTPVELTTRGTDGGTTTRFGAYQELPLKGNRELLSLTAQHPTAKIDRSVADFQAAQERLFPHG